MRPLEEQVVLVTGATDGMGRAVAGELAAIGARVLLHGRNARKAQATAEDVRVATGSDRVEACTADLAALDQVRDLAEDVNRRTPLLTALVNNAAVGGGPRSPKERRFSADGHELRFAVNVLAPVLLTRLLLPLLAASAPARVVNVASVGQSPVALDDLDFANGYHPFEAYRRSKLGLILATFALAERLPADQVTVNCLHPATLMDTTMVAEGFGRAVSTVAEGTAATVRLVTDPDLDGVTGRYFDGLTESRAHPQAYDRHVRERLWERLEQLTAAPVGGD